MDPLSNVVDATRNCSMGKHRDLWGRMRFFRHFIELESHPRRFGRGNSKHLQREAIVP
jgi:hypothetical protein